MRFHGAHFFSAPDWLIQLGNTPSTVAGVKVNDLYTGCLDCANANFIDLSQDRMWWAEERFWFAVIYFDWAYIIYRFGGR